jgi:DNA-binding IclR family transcriptional regulator
MVKSLSKALKILRLFSEEQSEWRLNAMIEATGFHKSSIQRLVKTLEEEGFLERVPAERTTFRLGLQMFILGRTADPYNQLRAVARPSLEKLVETTGETAHLCVADQAQCLYIMKLDSPSIMRMVTRPGLRLPLHCTAVGKALLSGMNESEVTAVIRERGLPRFTKNTVTQRKDLMKELERIRREGMAVDEEEREIGLKCIAAPVFDSKAKLIAAVSISGPAQRITKRVIPTFGARVKEAGAEISKRLGLRTDRKKTNQIRSTKFETRNNIK